MSSNSVKSSYDLQTKYKTPEEYLTKRERKILEETNALANDASERQTEQMDLFHLSLKQLLRNWSNSMQAILVDLTDTLDINKDLKNTNNIYEFMVVFFNKLWNIFTKEYRIIYFGMTLIFISMVIYFVFISSA
jgi:uncharacterized membrane protein